MVPWQETSLAPSYVNIISFGNKCTALKKVLATMGLFSSPSDLAPGTIRISFPPRYASAYPANLLLAAL